MNAGRPRPRLYLVIPEWRDAPALVSALDRVLQAGDIAAFLLRLTDGDERTLINRAKSVAAAVQSRDIALLLDGRPDLVVRAGADGAHLTGIDALRGALPVLKPDRIAGVGGLHSRHDAMLAGEVNADYVMFGEPDRQGDRPPVEMAEERLAWWSELFQSPCVGYAASADEILRLAQAGADFVALGEWIWKESGGAEKAVAEATKTLATVVA